MSDRRPWPWPRILAHRGGGALAPENTLAAIRRGFELGFRGIECDARLSRDEVPVLIHDRTLERTTDGIGAVAEASAADLAQLDAGRWFGQEFRGEPLPTLEATIDFCRARGIWINLEIKRLPGHTARIGEVVAQAVARQYADVLRAGGDRAGNVVPTVPLLSSFGREALAAARESAPDVPRGWLVGSIPPGWQRELEALGCVSLHVDHETLTRQAVRQVKDEGYWLFCYTVDDPQRAGELFEWGIDALCTDRIDRIGPGFA